MERGRAGVLRNKRVGVYYALRTVTSGFLCLLIASAVFYSLMSMRQDAQSNRERDDRIDVVLGLYQGVMAYDLEVRFEGERTGLQKDHMVRMIAGLELDRAAKISDKTSKICGNAAFEEASTMITDTRWNRPCGIRLRSFFAGDLSDSPWDGQQELAGLETDDEFDREQLTYQWRKDPSLGRWGARKYAIRGWENKVLHDQVQLQCWEDRERLLLKLMIEMTQGAEFVDGVLSGVPYPTVVPLQVRNVAIGAIWWWSTSICDFCNLKGCCGSAYDSCCSPAA